MSKMISGAIAGALLGAAGSATAMPVVFDWSDLGNGNDYTTSSLVDSNMGLTISISGHNGNVYVDRSGSNPDGLGVYSGRGDSDDVDGSGPNQGLWLTFSEEVTLQSLRFLDDDHNYNFSNSWFSVDEFDLFADGASVLDGYNIEDHDVNGHVDLLGYTGTSFLVRVDDYNDDWYLNGLTAYTHAQVPEPGSLALLGLGMAALGATRRKRRV